MIRVFLFLSVAFFFVQNSISHAADIVVYSARKEYLIKPLIDAYAKESGVGINYITGDAGVLMKRLEVEGSRTPADIFLTVDAGNLWQAAEKGLLQPVASEILSANIPEYLCDPNKQWFGLSVRARALFYNTKKVKPQDLSTYAALADPKWKDRLLLRTSKKVYNQSLVAAMIAEHGEEKTQAIVEGWVKNLAAAPLSSDTKALEAVAAGVGDVTIVNTYYYGRLLKKDPDFPVGIFWPDQDGSGVHVNISGAGVTKHAPNRDKAVALLEWLSGEKAQALFASLNMEYPANPAVSADPIVESWEKFKANPMNVAKYGELQARAVKLIDRAAYK
jgi:iron(III) transport system substrate-binding protein